MDNFIILLNNSLKNKSFIDIINSFIKIKYNDKSYLYLTMRMTCYELL
jgi:hypothetical protein